MHTNKTITLKLNILLVEDEQADRMMISKAVNDSGFDADIKFSENVEDALTMTSIYSFDCILLDYYFSNTANGFDFIRTYRARGGDAPIIMITSYNEPALVVESMKMGVADYIAKKDISPESIAKSLNYILRLREAEAHRILAEKALLESELRLKTIVERSPVIVFTIDANGYFKLFKGKGVSVLSIKPENIIGHNITDIWQHLPITLNDYQSAIKGISFNCQTEVNDHHFEVNYIPVTNPQQKITSMMGVAIDITGFKRNEEQLLNTIEITEAAARIKEQFLANMSHEIRTPIHGIISLIQFLINTQVNDEQKNYLQLISKSADNLLSIVNDILDLSKIEAGKMNIEEIPFDIHETVHSCIATLSIKAREKKLKIYHHIDHSVSQWLCGDPVRLVQILNNLVGNAIKFTEKGEVNVTLTTTVSNEENSVIQIKVKDTGIGIPASKLPHIFDSFTQAGSDISRKYGGTGLGLTIARKLIEQQNGTIETESRINEGTTFTLSIPYKISQPANTKTMNNTTTIHDLHNMHILVAEDNDINRFIIEKMINSSGARMTFVTSGEETIRAVSAEDFDLVLMDIEMPGMNGYQAAEIIRNELKKTDLPIIAMTGHAMPNEKNKCMESGMDDYISKPFQSGDLSAIIAKWSKKHIAAPAVQEKEDTMSMEKTCYTNLDFLREISDGNEAFFKEFIQLFLNSAPQSITDMQKHYDESNWELLRQVSHKIKPSFNYIGLKELNLAAAKIEECAKRQEGLSDVPALIDKIRTICASAFQELESEIKAGLSA
jgi:PAS domain S-box-containing protein